jgi:hypothetical protein
MKLALRSIVVLLVGCLVAAGSYFALSALPSGSLPAGPHAEGARAGGPPSGEYGAPSARPQAGAAELQGGRPDRSGGPEGHGDRAGHGGGSGVFGPLIDAFNIAIVTVIVVLIGRAMRSRRGREVGDPASELV